MSFDIIKPKDLAIRTVLDGTEFDVVYVPSTERLERSLKNNLSNFITIDNTVFRFIKGYTGSVKNISAGLEINDFIADAVIRVSGTNIYVGYAMFNGGTETDFGTYSTSTGSFTGGSYTFFNYLEL